jgi:Cu-processing system permease protein
MSAVYHLAKRELLDGIRNRWVAAIVVALASLAIVLALIGTAPGGNVGSDVLSVTTVSLSSLSMYFLPLIALLLSYDSIVGEQERGTLGLLLSYPLARWQVIVGKFAGHMAIITIAIVVGYGSAAAMIGFTQGVESQGAIAFAALCASSVLLGAVFLSVGYLLSCLSDERAKAAGFAIGLWLLLVVIYDLALFGMLLFDKSQIVPRALLEAMLIFNPTDAFRLLNLTFVESVRDIGGLAGYAADGGRFVSLPIAAMVGWLTVFLGASVFVFSRKEV